MAKPIKPTPTLTGTDAENIIAEVECSSFDAQKHIFLKECKSVFNSTQK